MLCVAQRPSSETNMASVSKHDKSLVIVTNNNVVTYELGSCHKKIYKCEKLQKKEESGDSNAKEVGTDRILADRISASGKYFACCDDHKQLTIWKIGEEWEKISTRNVARRVVALVFDQSEDNLLVADKTGDVYSFSISKPEEEGQLLLGHVSMLLDLALIKNGKFIVSTDRDEKVRISHYPNSYSTYAYCLGHTDFVSRVLYFHKEEILLSGSGDGTLRLWNCDNAQELACNEIRKDLGMEEKADKKEEKIEEKSAQPVAVEEGAAVNKGGDDDDSGVDDDDDKSEKDDDEENGSDTGGKSYRPFKLNLCPVDIKCLTCYEKQNLVAVGVDKQKCVLIYQMTSKEKQYTLTFIEKIDLEAELWSMTFDEEGRLWILQPCQEKPLVVFTCKNNEKTPCLVEDKDEEVIKMQNAVKDDWSLLKESLDVESIFPSLHKTLVDNHKEYMDRKQQRIQDLSEKRKAKDRRKNQKKRKINN